MRPIYRVADLSGRYLPGRPTRALVEAARAAGRPVHAFEEHPAHRLSAALWRPCEADAPRAVLVRVIEVKVFSRGRAA